MTIEFILISFIIAACSFTFSHVLTEQGMPFYFLTTWQLPDIIRKPLYACVVCCAGQWALWVSVLFLGHLKGIQWQNADKKIALLVAQIILTMFFSYLIDKWRARF